MANWYTFPLSNAIFNSLRETSLILLTSIQCPTFPSVTTLWYTVYVVITFPLFSGSFHLRVIVSSVVLTGSSSISTISGAPTQDEIARIRKRKPGRNMLNCSGNTTDNLCFRYRFRDVFSRFRCCVYNGTGPLLRKHNGNMELHVSATFQKYGNMWFRPVPDWCQQHEQRKISSNYTTSCYKPDHNHYQWLNNL